MRECFPSRFYTISILHDFHFHDSEGMKKTSSGAAKHWRSMHAASPAEAKGGLAWLLRRRWAMTVLRENARLKLERLQFVGRGAVAAAHRRAAPLAASGVAARRAACTFWQGPRLFGHAHADV